MTSGHAARLARIVEAMGAEMRPWRESDERSQRVTRAWLDSLPALRSAERHQQRDDVAGGAPRR